jgi:hypothetical protein
LWFRLYIPIINTFLMEEYIAIGVCSSIVICPILIIFRMCMQAREQEQQQIEQLDAEENLLESSYQVNIAEEQQMD